MDRKIYNAQKQILEEVKKDVIINISNKNPP